VECMSGCLLQLAAGPPQAPSRLRSSSREISSRLGWLAPLAIAMIPDTLISNGR
jgi:hypothetical protein